MNAVSVDAFGSTAALVLSVALVAWDRPDVAGLGTIVRGSTVQIGPWVHRITLEHPTPIGRGWPSGEKIDVYVVGELPETVCDGTRVYVRGTETSNGVVTTVVESDSSKYDSCFQWHCHPDAYEACRGGTKY